MYSTTQTNKHLLTSTILTFIIGPVAHLRPITVFLRSMVIDEGLYPIYHHKMLDSCLMRILGLLKGLLEDLTLAPLPLNLSNNLNLNFYQDEPHHVNLCEGKIMCLNLQG